jgi:hypothetical protein
MSQTVSAGLTNSSARPTRRSRCRHRVYREHLIPGRDQGRSEQAPVSADPDHHLDGSLLAPDGQFVEPGDPLYTLGQPTPAQPLAVLIVDVHVIMRLLLSPVGSSLEPEGLQQLPMTLMFVNLVFVNLG